MKYATRLGGETLYLCLKQLKDSGSPEGRPTSSKEYVVSPSDLKEKPRNTRRIIAGIAAVAWAALVFIASAIPGNDYPPHPEPLNIVAHFCLYLMFAVLLTLAFNGPKRALWISALIALVVASLYGISDEVHQLFVPGRSSDPMDWLVDTTGALVGATATIWLLSARKVKKSRARDGE